MKLVKFKVTNFRSVTDSGWIEASDVTALIGENEAGKTNILLPLWKFNPSGNGEISLLDDMPRSRYAEMRNVPEEYIFIECIFELTDEERAVTVRFGADNNKNQTLLVSRDFAGNYHWSFANDKEFNLTEAHEKADPHEIDGNEETEEVDIGSSLAEHLQETLPKFVYYSNYGNLDAQIYLPRVVEDLQRTDLGAKEAAKVRTLSVLFDLVNLSPEEILELGKSTSVTERVNHQGQRVGVEPKTDEQIKLDDIQVRERNALLQSASSKLTKSFRDWWKQGDYRFRLHADGSYFQIWVSDDRRDDEIELENRSTGLQWFLSFYLVFTYESEDNHENAIVLLDEPGLSLHPLAQRDLSRFFDNLSNTHQLLFTTHSPFLIDADRLDRVRKVYINEKGETVASSNLGVSRGLNGGVEAGATYAVHSALNLSVAESLLLGCTPVIVEGPSDQHYLSAIKNILIRLGKIKPPSELVFPPSGGAKTAKIIAAILMGRDEKLPMVLLDSDIPGKQAAKALQENLYQNNKEQILLTDNFIDGFTSTEIEDLIPTSLLIQVLDRMERRAQQDFEEFHIPQKPIIPQIKEWAKKEGLELVDGWKIQLSLGVKSKLLSSTDKYVGAEVIDAWTKLFKKFY